MDYILDGHRGTGGEDTDGRGWVTWCTLEEERLAVERVMHSLHDIERDPQDGHLSEETAFRFLRASKLCSQHTQSGGGGRGGNT